MRKCNKLLFILLLFLSGCSHKGIFHPSSLQGASMHAGQGYLDSQAAALAQGEGVGYERMKDFVEDGDYVSQVIQLDDGTIIILDDDVYVVEGQV